MLRKSLASSALENQFLDVFTFWFRRSLFRLKLNFGFSPLDRYVPSFLVHLRISAHTMLAFWEIHTILEFDTLQHYLPSQCLFFFF